MLSSKKNNESVIDISSHQKMLYGGYDISEELWQKGMNRKMGRARGRYCCAWFSLPSLHRPPDRKVMDEATKENRSGESASNHLESITCLIRARPCLNYGTRCHCSLVTHLFSGSPRAPENPALQPLCWQHAFLPPHSTLAVEEWSALHEELLLKNVSRPNFLVAFFRLKSEAMHTHTRARITDGGERASVTLITASVEWLMSWNWS